MKRFIRTKDGKIIDLLEYRQDNLNVDEYISIRNGDSIWLTKQCVFKDSDTIEDLCDAFCLCGNDGTKIVYNVYDFRDFKKKILSNSAWIRIYGAIWTDKGLIYVAKIDDKGELKLL